MSVAHLKTKKSRDATTWRLYNDVGIENSLLSACELQIRKNGNSQERVLFHSSIANTDIHRFRIADLEERGSGYAKVWSGDLVLLNHLIINILHRFFTKIRFVAAQITEKILSPTQISKNRKNLTLARFFRCSMWKRTKTRFHNLKF